MNPEWYAMRLILQLLHTHAVDATATHTHPLITHMRLILLLHTHILCYVVTLKWERRVTLTFEKIIIKTIEVIIIIRVGTALGLFPFVGYKGRHVSVKWRDYFNLKESAQLHTKSFLFLCISLS